MAIGKRVAPYRQKGRKKRKEVETKHLQTIQIDKAETSARIQKMSEAEMAALKKKAAENALTMFNSLLEELQKRIPKMTDADLQGSLISVWEKINQSGKK